MRGSSCGSRSVVVAVLVAGLRRGRAHAWPQAGLSNDDDALARLDVPRFSGDGRARPRADGGRRERAGPHPRRRALARAPLRAGERLTVELTVRRPGVRRLARRAAPRRSASRSRRRPRTCAAAGSQVERPARRSRSRSTSRCASSGSAPGSRSERLDHATRGRAGRQDRDGLGRGRLGRRRRGGALVGAPLVAGARDVVPGEAVPAGRSSRRGPARRAVAGRAAEAHVLEPGQRRPRRRSCRARSDDAGPLAHARRPHARVPAGRPRLPARLDRRASRCRAPSTPSAAGRDAHEHAAVGRAARLDDCGSSSSSPSRATCRSTGSRPADPVPRDAARRSSRARSIRRPAVLLAVPEHAAGADEAVEGGRLERDHPRRRDDVPARPRPRRRRHPGPDLLDGRCSPTRSPASAATTATATSTCTAASRSR